MMRIPDSPHTLWMTAQQVPKLVVRDRRGRDAHDFATKTSTTSTATKAGAVQRHSFHSSHKHLAINTIEHKYHK